MIKELSRNVDAMEFNDYCVAHLNKKKERLLRNTFSGRESKQLQQAPHLSSYNRMGYYVEKEGNGVPKMESAMQSMRSMLTSNIHNDRPKLLKTIIRDELNIFDEAEIDYIVE